MKTGLFLVVFSCLLLAGCMKDESNAVIPISDLQKIEKSTTFIRMNLADEANRVQTMSTDILKATTVYQVSARTSQNFSANGHFSPLEGWFCTFSGMQNNGGLHGNALLTGPLFSIHMETECLIVEDNQAVYEGLITQVFFQDDDFCGGCLMPGMYLSFEVIDNGEGQNAPLDQIGEFIWLSDESLCELLPPGSEFWGNLLEVVGQGDQIQVK